MARSRLDLGRFRPLSMTTPRIALVLAAGALVACGASSAERSATASAAGSATKKNAEPSSDEAAKRFVARLIEQNATRIARDPKSCLSGQSGPATVGAELAAIFGQFIDSDWSFAISSSCEEGEGPTRQFCILSFFHKAGDEEASAGFTFLGNPADGRFDPATLECFQTP